MIRKWGADLVDAAVTPFKLLAILAFSILRLALVLVRPLGWLAGGIFGFLKGLGS